MRVSSDQATAHQPTSSVLTACRVVCETLASSATEKTTFPCNACCWAKKLCHSRLFMLGRPGQADSRQRRGSLSRLPGVHLLRHDWVHLLINNLLNSRRVVFPFSCRSFSLRTTAQGSSSSFARFCFKQTVNPGAAYPVEEDIHQITVLEKDPVQDGDDFALDQVSI